MARRGLDGSGVKLGESGVRCESGLVGWGAREVRCRVARVGPVARHGRGGWRVVRPHRPEVGVTRAGVQLLGPAVGCGAERVGRRRAGVRRDSGREESNCERGRRHCDHVSREAECGGWKGEPVNPDCACVK